MDRPNNVKIFRSTSADILIHQLGRLIQEKKSTRLLREQFPDNIIGKYLSIGHDHSGVTIRENWGPCHRLAHISHTLEDHEASSRR